MKKNIALSLFFITLACTFHSCKPKANNELVTADGNFPAEVANIIVNKCATSGCHDASSYTNSAALLLDSWEHLFQGDAQGAVVIPYCTQYSLLLYRVNTDASLGFVLPPTMPYSSDHSILPLSKSEYLTLYNWIKKGAPDKYGNVAFSSNPDTRQKIYLTDQGSDLITVVDAKSMLTMRCITIGLDSTRIEAPHCLAVSSDGMSVYVGFSYSSYIQKIDTRTDSVVGNIDAWESLPTSLLGSSGIITTAPAADTAIAVTNWQDYPTGSFDIIHANPLVNEFFFPNSGFIWPHGITSNYAFDTFYIGATFGNCIYKFSRNALNAIPPQNPVTQISIDNNQVTVSHNSTGTTPDPHEIQMSPDYSRYFVTCQNTNEVRVMDAHADTLMKVIPVGTYPQEVSMSLNPATPYLFVACMYDNSTYPGAKGSVYVINYNTYQVVAKLYGDFLLPHDVAVDDRDGLVFIPSTNSNTSLPPSCHCILNSCYPGWYSVYNLSTLQPVNKIRYVVGAGAYSIGARFSQ